MNDSHAETVSDGGYLSKKLRPELQLSCDEFIFVKNSQRLCDICWNDRRDDLDV